MTLARILPLLSTLAAAATFLGCDEEQVYVLTPAGEFEPASIDFGEVTVGTSRTEGALLRNTGQPAFTIRAVTIPMGFTLQTTNKEKLDGATLGPGDVIELEVGFLAIAEGARDERIVVDADGTEIVLAVKGIGLVRRIPELAIEPASLDFGVVEIGQEARRTVTVHNRGNLGGLIDRASLGSTGLDIVPSDEYTLATLLPISVPEGGSAPLELVFRPKLAGVRSDTVIFGTGGVGVPLQISVSGEGLVPRGDIVCTPSAVDFGRVERGMSATRQVSCAARGGDARLVAARLAGASTMFRIVTRVGTADLNSGDAVTIDLEFNAQGLPGGQTEGLLVDYNGGMGLATARVTLNAEVIPPPATATAIALKLSWDTNFTDADIHLVRPGGQVFDENNESDCFYGEPHPDWNVRGDNTDDPFLDTDDVNGYGPEEINLSSTAPGRYEVYVHYYDDKGLGRTTVTVEVHVAGRRIGSYNRQLRCDQLWLAGTVDWDGMNGTFTPTGQVTSVSEGNCR